MKILLQVVNRVYIQYVYFFALILISAFMPNKILHRMIFGALVGKK